MDALLFIVATISLVAGPFIWIWVYRRAKRALAEERR
jgi:hypothetical protein